MSKCSTKHLQSEISLSLNSVNPCKRNKCEYLSPAFLTRLGKMIAVRSLFDSSFTVKEDSLIWSTASFDTLVFYTNFSKVDSARRRVSGLGSSSQWEGGTPKSSSHTRNRLTLVSPNQLSSCCCSFISTGEWPVYTR